MKVQAFGIEDGKWVACAVENGGGVFRMPIPPGPMGQQLVKLVTTAGTVVHLELEQDDDGMKIKSISAVA